MKLDVTVEMILVTWPSFVDYNRDSDCQISKEDNLKHNFAVSTIRNRDFAEKSTRTATKPHSQPNSLSLRSASAKGLLQNL
jgi:hypothetical protein